MNTHDVSAVPQFAQLLLEQKQSLQNAKSQKGQRLKRRSRDQVIMDFMLRVTTKLSDAGFNIRTSFLPPAYSPCISPLADLTKAVVNDLLLETHHRGRYLMLRSVTPPKRMTAILTIVEDEDKVVTPLQIYYQQEENERAAKDILGEGAVLVVKEPYMKLMGDGNHGIRVDHLSDIVRLPEYDERIPDCWKPRLMELDVPASVWKTNGNDCFKESKYYTAIEHYTKALSSSPTVEEAQNLRINRSLTFFKTDQFDAGLADLEFIPNTPKSVEKVLFRKSQALYKLRKYRECSQVLKTLLIKYPNNVDAKDFSARIDNRLVEQETGRYQFKQLYAEARKQRPPHLDHSTYTGAVAVKVSGSRGRGLFTTETVQAGDLLLCEKAFAHAFVDYAHGSEQNRNTTLLINPETNTITMGAQAELIQTIVQKLYRNPSLAPVVTDLHRGTYESVGIADVDGTPIVDTFFIKRIISLNCFGCPLSSRQTYLRTTENRATQDNEEQFQSCGIWPMASYINHCCYGNARRAFIGDMMIVRATQDLAPDTEITFWYCIPAADGSDQHQKKFQHWGFRCDCAICQDEQTTKTSVLARRKRMRADLLRAFKSGTKADVAKIETTLAAMADDYRRPAYVVPRLCLWDPLLVLTRMHMLQKKPVKAIDSALRALASLGYIIDGGTLPRTVGTPMAIRQWGLMHDRLIECWMMLSGAYHFLAPDLETQAEQYARISYKIYIGENETFDDL